MRWICCSTGTSITLTQQEILHYLEHIKEVWSRLLDRVKQAMQKVDQVHSNLKALEPRTPRFSRLDAQAVQNTRPTAKCSNLQRIQPARS